MAKPYLDTYKNNDGDIVILYIPEVNPMESCEPDFLVVKAEHLSTLIESLDEMAG